MRGKGDLLRKGRNVEKWGGGGLWEQGECLRHIGHTCGETRPTEPARRNQPAQPRSCWRNQETLT